MTVTVKEKSPNWTEQVSPAGTQPLPPRHHLSLCYLRWCAGQPPSHTPPTGWHSRFPADLQAPTTWILTRLGFGKDRYQGNSLNPSFPHGPLSWSLSCGATQGAW